MAEQIPLKAVKSSGVATALAEYAAGDYDAPIYLPPIFTDYISGLVMTWISGTSISVSSGACYVPSLGYVLAFPTAVTKSSLPLGANNWYHIYGFLNGATPDVEIVTTAPATPYSGKARTKTGDTSRRYIGSFRTDASGNIHNFDHSPQKGEITYRLPGVQFRVLSNGSATTATTISCSTAIPVTSRSAYGRVLNLASTSANLIVGPGDAAVTTTDYFVAVAFGGQAVVTYLPTDSSQQLKYLMSAAVSGAYIDLYGYAFER